MYGYGGTIIRVNLTNKTVKKEPLPQKLAKEYIGGRGFIAKMMYEELPPNVQPLSSENKVYVATGPLSGVLFPSSAKIVFGTKSPLTGGYIDSNMGGFIMAELKYAGYDMIIFEGSSENPVYLFIDDDKVEIRDASKYWRKGAIDTEYEMKKDLGEEFQIATIGPAGENMVHFASIHHDIGRQAGRGGVAAVFGYKKVKAIAIKGTKPIPVKDIDGLREHTKQAIKEMYAHSFFPTFSKYGTTDVTDWVQSVGVLPTRNFNTGSYEKEKQINGPYMRENIYLRDKACFACPLGCSTYTYSKKYGTYVEGPEYETIGMMGSNLAMDSIHEVQALNYVVDNMGMDSISAGATVAFAMELFEKGILTSEDFSGLKMNFGNFESAKKLLEMIARREGIGDILALGTSKASQKIGKDSYKYSIHVKGLDYSAYETRSAPAMMLAYMTSDIGAQHTRAWAIVQDIDMGREKIEGKAKVVYDLQHIRPLMELFGVCRFPWLEVKLNFEHYTKALNLVTGENYTTDDLKFIGEKIWNLTRSFWVREVDSFGRKFDYPPPRVHEPVPDGPTKGAFVKQEDIEKLLDDYYDLYKWDKNGLPTYRRLKELGLDFVAEDLVKKGKIIKEEGVM